MSTTLTITPTCNTARHVPNPNPYFNPNPNPNSNPNQKRPGCPLCREQAELLADMIEYNLTGTKLVGIVHERTYMEDILEFQEKYFNGNPIYLDEEKEFYKAQGNRWLGLYALLWPSVISAIRRNGKTNVKGNTRGEGRLLGGLLVMSSEAILFEHREEYFGDLATIDSIKMAVGEF